MLVTSWKAHRDIYRIRGNDFDWEMLIFELLSCFSSKREFFLKSLALWCVGHHCEEEIKFSPSFILLLISEQMNLHDHK